MLILFSINVTTFLIQQMSIKETNLLQYILMNVSNEFWSWWSIPAPFADVIVQGLACS